MKNDFCSSIFQPRKYPEEERDIMLEDEIARLPTEEERRREVILAPIHTRSPNEVFQVALQGGSFES